MMNTDVRQVPEGYMSMRDKLEHLQLFVDNTIDRLKYYNDPAINNRIAHDAVLHTLQIISDDLKKALENK
jgi:hypothetical protein